MLFFFDNPSPVNCPLTFTATMNSACNTNTAGFGSDVFQIDGNNIKIK
jgi:predicted small secreted protein